MIKAVNGLPPGARIASREPLVMTMKWDINAGGRRRLDSRGSAPVPRTNSLMQLIPVLDLLNGQVVRGIAGQRDIYAPIQSLLVNSSDPLETCRVLLERFAPEWMYVADLDGIMAGEPQFDLIGQLAALPVKLAIDAGTASLSLAERMIGLGADRVIIGLETLPVPQLLDQFISECGVDRIAFSVDLKNGQPLRTWSDLETPEQIVLDAVRRGVNHFVVLDLAGVGLFQGVATSRFCEWIKQRMPFVDVWTGAGVRSLTDFQELAARHLDGVLVASALHDGRITPEDWKNYKLAEDALTSVWTDE